jgi:hypothetical protein
MSNAAISTLLVCIVFAGLQLRATTIVIMRTATGFVVAADSRLTDSNGQPLPAMVCKIFEQDGDVIWGFGGLNEQGTFRPIEMLKPLTAGKEVHRNLAHIRDVLIPALSQQAM